ncbi:MAG: hypothetical protein A2087_03770 [Spirochaetes bacterium GWD1_61_31]|nr:MAG: hypothetical protein A2Y37_05320 [Spirochaetes bacterium GWB1_60_80]OHD33247.1 MAG: hypothetical protein A2004_09450 [Spirochaetes bacterium GWC1_61_12]OHD35083.1 MAG: hypothetical protein A2087_03770 [Spirochaetes bacterium GWD1_61_31]OHD42751.1 MAG: hypothetical protein A2Y35_05700 [Spirochaetes bacterium GWE1_60_18]OHD58603.1 MAG: hypothetical protein A2Y32_04625 [Spirochaetes bacterium GWF1_60_12]HAP44438.1 hypothetical protein [Spirochaetaceae bacterium]
MQIPVLIQVLLIFGLVVAASAKKVHLGLAAALGGILFALWRGLPPLDLALTVGSELLNPDTLLLLALVIVIMVFSAAMKKAGAMHLFSQALGALVPSRRLALALAPLIIGTLPMPGGAILSAPLVDSFDPDRARGPATLSAANYWFRHSMELAWPLYPAFILTATLSGLSVGRLILLNFYAIPVLFGLGLIFILPRQHETALALRIDGLTSQGGQVAEGANGIAGAGSVSASLTDGGSRRARLSLVVQGFAPLLIVLGVYGLLDLIWRQMSPGLGLPAAATALIGRYAWIFCGLAAGLVYVVRRYGRPAIRGSLSAATLKLAAVVAGIRVFAALLGAGGVAVAAATELAAAGIPFLAAVAILPFVAGLVTGVGFGYVGLSFPIILGLAPADGSFPLTAMVALAGAFGYAGMMLSPLHVCMVVTATHFGTSLLATIRRFALPLILFVVVAIAYVALLARFKG